MRITPWCVNAHTTLVLLMCVRIAILKIGKALSSCRLSRQSLWSLCTDAKHQQIPQQISWQWYAMIMFHGLRSFLWSTKEWTTAGSEALDPGNKSDIDRIRNCVAQCDICDELGSCKCTIRSTACCWVTHMVFCWCCASVTNGTFPMANNQKILTLPLIFKLQQFQISQITSIFCYHHFVNNLWNNGTNMRWWHEAKETTPTWIFSDAAPQRYHEFLQVEVAHVWPTPLGTWKKRLERSIPS